MTIDENDRVAIEEQRSKPMLFAFATIATELEGLTKEQQTRVIAAVIALFDLDFFQEDDE